MTTLITTDPAKIDRADRYTDALLTVRLGDGSYGFSDGFGGSKPAVEVRIPGYDVVYGRAVASAEHDDASDALAAAGADFPRGSVMELCD